MRYRFGDHVLDTRTLELLAGDSNVELEPQVFSVLAYLVEHRDHVVTKEELLDNVWGDRFVSESALTTRIKQARQAVGDSGRRQQVIKTLHGRGYRFVATVETEAEAGTEASPEAGAEAARTLPAVRSAVTAIPRTHYATNDGTSIAYQTFGDGPDVVLICGFTTNVEVQWEHPAIAAFLHRLGSFARVTVLDKRGVGLSDRIPHDEAPSLETRADDLRAVMDAARIERATMFGSSEGGSLAIVFTASAPERAERLILHGTWVRHPQFPERPAREIEEVDRLWGTGAVYANVGPALDAVPGGREFLARYERQSATPAAARHLRQLTGHIDVEGVLPAIAVPTLVLHRRGDARIPFRFGEELAAKIKTARLVALAGSDHYLFSGDVDEMLAAIERFVTADVPPPAEDHVLATVLCAEVVDDGPVLAERLEPLAAAAVDRFRGVLVAVAPGRVLATFDGPGRAVRAAASLRDALGANGVALRSGLHTAEIARRGDEISGLGVDVARQVAAAAEPGEVWVSRTVTDLVAGTGLTFAPRGSHELAGLAEPLPLSCAEV